MAKIFAVVALLLGGLLAYQGVAVWNTCGYDCAAVAGWASFTATASTLLGLLLLSIGALVLLAVFVGNLRTNRHQR
jgi:hypothetical protein